MDEQDKQEKTKTSLEKGFEKLLTPFDSFIKDQTTSSVLLIVSTLIAIIIANSYLYHDYESLLETPLGFVFGDISLNMSLRHWINEGLMAFFFFLLGMEIKREMLVGELREIRQFMLVVAAAAGGMLVPASIYYFFNAGTEYAKGWGIPMATDTAFVIGILALLGKRVHVAAFTFLTALAIIDDLGAIVVIALFYSEAISSYHLAVCAVLLAVMILLNNLGIRRPSIYFTGGFLIWLAMLGSGIHATIAGIIIAATVPARPKYETNWFVGRVNNLIERFKHVDGKRPATAPILGEGEKHALIEEVKDAAEKSTTPLRRWERALEHPVGLFVMPVFALANAGIPLNMHVFSGLWSNSMAAGILLGLVAGKGLGISLFAWLAMRLKIGRMPSGLDLRHIIGLGLLGGIGFTMSIFISNLGFEDAPQVLMNAKAAILTGSFIAGTCGYLWLMLISQVKNDD